MKTTIFLPLMFCCVVAAAQEPVQLEVWTTVKGKLDQFEFPLGISGGLSYIPDFRNGQIPHAFVVNYRPFDATFEQREGKVLTWGFSTPNDTINRYTWGGKNFIPIFFPDINGDGYRDFMNKDALYFFGTAEDIPDTSKQYQYPGNVVGYAQFNNDKCDDLYYHGSNMPYIAHFRFGNTVAGKYHTATITSTYAQQDVQLEEVMKALYKNKQGQWRLLTQSHGWKSGLYKRIYQSKKSALRLYALEFITVNADSTVIKAIQIDEYKDPKWLDFEEDHTSKDPSRWLPLNDAGLLYQSENYPKILYYASMNTMPDKQTKKYESYATFFDLSNDKITPSNTVVNIAAPECKILKHSIDGDNLEDMYVKSGPFIYLYSVDATGIVKNTLRFTLPEDRYKGGLNTLQSISDINNDGIHDITLMSTDYKVGNYFAIVLGKNITTSTTEENNNIFSIGLPYPLPNSSRLTIPLHIAKNGLYSLTLFSIQGSAYSLFVNKEMNEGKTDFMMDISPYSSGNYILRLTDDKNSVEKNIVITK